jgi:hypothetical protein
LSREEREERDMKMNPKKRADEVDAAPSKKAAKKDNPFNQGDK